MTREKVPEYKIFAERLRYALDKRGIQQKEFTEMMDTSTSIISCYVTQKSKPESGKISEMATALKVSDAWLLGANVNIDGTPLMADDDPARLQLANFIHKADIETVKKFAELLKLTNWADTAGEAPENDKLA